MPNKKILKTKQKKQKTKQISAPNFYYLHFGFRQVNCQMKVTNVLKIVRVSSIATIC